MGTTKLLGTLLHQHGCVQHWLSQQLATTPNMLAWNLVTPNMVAWNLVTPNMVGLNLDILEHGYYEVTWNPVTPTWLCSTLVIATTPVA